MAGKLSLNLGILNAVGQYYAPQPPYAPQPVRRGSGLATAGGAMIMISGILGIITALQIFWAGENVDWATLMADSGYEISAEEIQNIVNICAAVVVIFAIIAMLGGLMAITKKSWGMGVLGGIFALLCIGPWGLASLLGLIGLILVVISKDDFRKDIPVVPPMAYAPPPPPPMPTAQPTRFCMGCGKQLDGSYNLCPYCGRPKEPDTPQK